MNSPHRRWLDGFVFAQVLALVLLVLSYVRIIGDSTSLAFRNRVLDSLYAGSIWGTTLGFNLVKFALGLLLVHLLFGVASWAMGHLSSRAWPSAKTTMRQHVLLWFVVLTVGLLANNAATYTSSSLGEPYAEIMTSQVLGVALGRGVLILVLAFAALTALRAGVRWWQDGGRVSRRGAVGLGALGAAYLAVSAHSFLPERSPAPADRPNVILIGIDSLRADLLDEKISPDVTPHIAAFMRDGTHFTNAMTPLARTFPSMVTMLTGRHPHSSGAVMNLLPRSLIDDAGSVPRALAGAGYHTVYATDETRFANIDESFGFTQTITPPIGASEFLIEIVADTPVLNAIVNTRLGAWLFPHLHGNRGASKTYDPDVFVERLETKLRVEQPTLIVTHLTLNHWPYTWAGAPIKRKGRDARWPPYYLRAAARVDQQFADVMALFERKGLLSNAIVVVYSDHGESFESPNEALVRDDDPVVQELRIKPTWGHGSTVLTAHQFQIVLGIRRFGDAWPAQAKVTSPVSFEDVAPTMLDALGLTTTARFDGKSLLGLIQGKSGADRDFEHRIRFTETEYQPPLGLGAGDDEVSPSQFEDALAVYAVDRLTDRITVKEAHLRQLLVDRQYAAIGDRHFLAAFPKRNPEGFKYISVNLDEGIAKQLLDAPSADEAELHELWVALHSKFAVLRQSGPVVANPTVANSGRTITGSVTK
jgi:hypothetical protein